MQAAARSLATAGLRAAPARAAVARAGAVRMYSAHAESDADFNKRWVTFFKSADELFEVQRGLNNVFSYDIVPSTEIVEAALRASRRVNDFPTAVRVFEGLKNKLQNDKVYAQYLADLKPTIEELGVTDNNGRSL